MKKYYIAALVTLCGFSVATAQKTIDYSNHRRRLPSAGLPIKISPIASFIEN
jgi:hypothetical protein